MCTGAFAWLWPWENEPVLEVHPPPIEGIIWYRPSRPDNMRYWFDAINRFLDGKSRANMRIQLPWTFDLFLLTFRLRKSQI